MVGGEPCFPQPMGAPEAWGGVSSNLTGQDSESSRHCGDSLDLQAQPSTCSLPLPGRPQATKLSQPPSNSYHVGRGENHLFTQVSLGKTSSTDAIALFDRPHRHATVHGANKSSPYFKRPQSYSSYAGKKAGVFSELKKGYNSNPCKIKTQINILPTYSSMEGKSPIS